MIEYNETSDMSMHALVIYNIVRAIKPKRILEIGIRSGVSTKAMLGALADGNNIKCEYNGCDINPACQKLQKNSSLTLLLHIMSSDELAKQWNKSIDILFIDGCHEYSQVKRDYINFSHFLKKNGFMFFHDTYPPNERLKNPDKCGTAYKILNDLKNDNTLECITLPYSYGLTICRKLQEEK